MAERTAAVARPKPRTPEMATQVTGVTHPALDEAPPFYFVFHPDRWTIIAGKLVPALQKFPLTAGVNGVEVERGGRVRFARARTALEEEGRTVVPYEWAPDGESYLQCLDTRPGGGRDIRETWISVFETASVGARETHPDSEAYAEWLEGLVASGKLPACDPATASRMLDRATERHEKALAESAKHQGHGPAHLRALQLGVEVEVLKAVVEAGRARAAKARPKAKRGPEIEGAS